MLITLITSKINTTKVSNNSRRSGQVVRRRSRKPKIASSILVCAWEISSAKFILLIKESKWYEMGLLYRTWATCYREGKYNSDKQTNINITRKHI